MILVRIVNICLFLIEKKNDGIILRSLLAKLDKELFMKTLSKSLLIKQS